MLTNDDIDRIEIQVESRSDTLGRPVPEGFEELVKMARRYREMIDERPTPEMIEAGAEYLYGHPRSSAIEWAKEDKFDSKAMIAEELYMAMRRAINSQRKEGGEG